MADITFPAGLTKEVKSDEGFFIDAVNATRTQADTVLDRINKAFKSENFEKQQKLLIEQNKIEIENLRLQQEANREAMKEHMSAAELQLQVDEDKRELKDLQKNFLKELSSTTKETEKTITSLKNNLEKNFTSFQELEAQIVLDMNENRNKNKSILEIKAYEKKYNEIREENTKKMMSAIEDVENELSELSKNGMLDAKTRHELMKQLIDLREQVDISKVKERDALIEELNENAKNIFIESKQSKIAELEQLKLDKEREKRERGATKKGSLLTTMLGPLRLITDPLLQAFKDKSTEEYITDIFMNKEKDRQKDEDKALEQRDKLVDLAESANAELEKLGFKERITDMDVAGAYNQAMAESEQKFVDHEQLMQTMINRIPQDLYKNEREEAEQIVNRRNTNRVLSSFFGPAKGMVTDKLEAGQLQSDTRKHLNYIQQNAGIPISAMPPMAGVTTSPISGSPLALPAPASMNENMSIFDKLPPNEATLLEKGGLMGAGFVYLGRLLGGGKTIKDKTSESKDGGIFNFLKKNAGGLLKIAAPLAAIAAGGAMIAAGAKMQKRDSDDAKKYFKEGKTGRGVETALLGDRARLTEENANKELGRTAGKTALLAGGAGILGAGLAGTGAMIGSVAGAGGLAAAGGLGAVGSAGLAAMGAVLPPVLIGAAVVTAGMVVAKGTQEAFELGWDKNQAAIQKELSDTMLSEDATTMEKVKAGASSLWKGLTGGIAGGIREAGKALDASKEEGSKSLGKHLLTAGRVVSGFFSGMIDTTMEGQRGKDTALWEKGAAKGLENLSDDEKLRLQQSSAYQEAVSSGKDPEGAMKAAYLSEAREKAIARGDLREDGMVVQEGNWLKGMIAGGATGGIGGALLGAIGGTALGKYFGQGDTGLAYKDKQTDEEYRQTFEYSKKKTELMGQGMSAEEADIAALEEQNRLYQASMLLRLKRSKEYRKTFDKQLKEGKSIKEAEEAALRVAKENKENTLSTTDLIKDKFNTMKDAVKNVIGNAISGIQNFFSGGTPPESSEVNDGLITKDGKVVKLSPDDNVYAFKNEPRVVRDIEAQRAMPDVPGSINGFTDAGIITAIQVLTDVLRKKEMSNTVISSNESVNFNQYRMADALL